MEERFDDGYYHIRKDMLDYPDAVVYCTYSRRGPGKTYGLLLTTLLNNEKLVYIKRTAEDVDFICSGDGWIDASPYAPINRDLGTDIHPISLRKGIAGIFHCNTDEETGKLEPYGDPLGYIVALSAAKKVKGFDMSDCSIMCVDEFIPQATEIVRRNEGEALMDIYMTIRRDRVKRKKPDLKLVLFANAENISCPITNELDLIDPCYELQASGNSILYNKERRFLLHRITEDEFPLTEEEIGGIGAFMKGTAWYAKSFDGEFSNNDFTNICEMSTKGFRCVAYIKYKQKDIYVCVRDSDGLIYLTDEYKGRVTNIEKYDLTLENHQRRFYTSAIYEMIFFSLPESKVRFKKYSFYDLIKNYKKYFSI